MREQRHPIRRIFGFVTKAFLLCCVLLGVFTVVGVFAGWIDFQYDQDRETLTIDVNAGEIKQTVSNIFGNETEEVGTNSADSGSDVDRPAPSAPAGEPESAIPADVADDATTSQDEENLTSVENESP